MSSVKINDKGARALYMVEQAHRIVELEKNQNAAYLIEADFEAHRMRYVHKMGDFAAALKVQGLRISIEN